MLATIGAGFAGTEAGASGASFYDTFDYLDGTRWYISDGWNNGDWHGCTWSRHNVSVSGGLLRLSLTTQALGDRQYSCGEIQTRAFHGYGTYEVRMRTVAESGTVSAFFTYTGPVHNNPWDEIDVEILGKTPTSFQANYYIDGTGGNEKIVPLGFDSSAAMADYAFVWAADSLKWYVDGQLVHQVSGSVPTTDSKLFMSLWNGRGANMESWLGQFSPSRFSMEMEIDHVAYTAPGDACQFPDSIVCSLVPPAVEEPLPDTSPGKSKPGNNKGGRKK